ncbi:hypothetical protein SSS_02863 [Sarcoptes scabiei]|uniref:Uncharacterized protein n=1 Tax=Sarcoptes scabiei TaxID=52283 RepID=A0A834R6K1_SARSC|nr:hypothetical protein SSS_02863 [Sarcoptes scabiei]
MDIDEDSNSNIFKKPSFIRQSMNPSPNQQIGSQSFSQLNTPIKSHSYRRSSSGILFNTMFCMSNHFRHLQRLHLESMEGGLNMIKQPQARAIFRSSLPATPIATPIYRESFPIFNEQSLLRKLQLHRTSSPRSRSHSRNSQMDTSDVDSQIQPMGTCSPMTIDEESLSSNSASSPNKITANEQFDLQSSLNDIYNKINDQFNPD